MTSDDALEFQLMAAEGEDEAERLPRRSEVVRDLGDLHAPDVAALQFHDDVAMAQEIGAVRGAYGPAVIEHWQGNFAFEWNPVLLELNGQGPLVDRLEMSRAKFAVDTHGCPNEGIRPGVTTLAIHATPMTSKVRCVPTGTVKLRICVRLAGHQASPMSVSSVAPAPATPCLRGCLESPL